MMQTGGVNWGQFVSRASAHGQNEARKSAGEGNSPAVSLDEWRPQVDPGTTTAGPASFDDDTCKVFEEMSQAVRGHQTGRLDLGMQAQVEVGRVHAEVAEKSRETQRTMSQTWAQTNSQMGMGMGYGMGYSGSLSYGGSYPTTTSLSTNYYSGMDASQINSSQLIQRCQQMGIDPRMVTLQDAARLGMDQNTMAMEMQRLGLDPYRQGLNNFGGFMFR